jgi:hypothetical protein
LTFTLTFTLLLKWPPDGGVWQQLTGGVGGAGGGWQQGGGGGGGGVQPVLHWAPAAPATDPRARAAKADSSQVLILTRMGWAPE